MKKLIFQVAVGEVPTFYESCMQSVQQYAERIGADYTAAFGPKLRIVPKNSQRSGNALKLGYLPIFEKEQAFEYLKHYDAICIIDADVYAMPGAPDIFERIGAAEFAGVLERDLPLREEFEKKLVHYSRDMFKPLSDVDWEWNKLGAAFYNMGVMLLSGSVERYLEGQTPTEFIHRAEFERFVNGEGRFRWSTDQVLLNWWVRRSGMPHVALDWRWNCLYSYVIPAALRQKPFFIHFNCAANLPRGGAEIPEIIARLT